MKAAPRLERCLTMYLTKQTTCKVGSKKQHGASLRETLRGEALFEVFIVVEDAEGDGHARPELGVHRVDVEAVAAVNNRIELQHSTLVWEAACHRVSAQA